MLAVPVPEKILVSPENFAGEVIQMQHHIQKIDHQAEEVQTDGNNFPPSTTSAKMNYC